MNDVTFQELNQALSDPKNIVITTHRNPDGDAYGSSLGLNWFLKQLGHEVTIVSPNDCPGFLKWMPGQSDIEIFESEPEKCTKILEKAQMVFTLDYNAFHRLGELMEPVMSEISPVFVMIDHHQEPEDFAKFSFVDPTMSSTSEMIYQFIERMGKKDLVDINIATCLYAGILTDTGSFRFPATTSDTHRVVANLLEKGANNSDIYNRIHDVNTYNRMQLLGKALNNMVVLERFHTAYITLSQNELNKFKFQRGDTEGFVNYALSLKNVMFAAIFIEDKKQKIIKISFRSVGDFSVNEFARKNFNGGGHINAAGGRSTLSLKETVKKFVEILPGLTDQLTLS
ncbi:DHH family phosphoesterase [Lutimonas zeaxanthinifaciens]|uniref:DHH family phosphoesterase n=1 Tax=Lutimonas zeaxanthinifaciens TaxID=3060215 RepID=UPI00265CDF38|nr:bifunctional oligoribonuclease/PAP phosphatase NrnA [Lutimonas sp. YSD2104]WKK64788.1 bifunctional oligoribonuclease/PAP phosphatase NrnA [Lutimonas sp. YSD2104]